MRRVEKNMKNEVRVLNLEELRNLFIFKNFKKNLFLIYAYTWHLLRTYVAKSTIIP